jgi:hypothetical protein
MAHFSPQNWKFGNPPIQPNTGAEGPRHTLPIDTVVPFEYFCLFHSTFLWCNFADYTNAKATMVSMQKDGNVRLWEDVSAAELRTWVASVMWWSLIKTMKFEKFYKCFVDPARVKLWSR